MSSYTKINLVIVVEVILLCIIGNIIKLNVPDFDMMYIIMPQWVLIITQLIVCFIRRHRILQKI